MGARKDRAKGRIVEAIGALADNKELKDKGRLLRVRGTAKRKLRLLGR